MIKRYAVGVYDPETMCFCEPEFSTNSRFAAWLYQQRIGWRELWNLFSGRKCRQVYIGTREG